MFQEWLKIGDYPDLLLKYRWWTFRIFLEGKAEKYSQDLRIITHWEPKSYGFYMQRASNYGEFKGKKLDLS